MKNTFKKIGAMLLTSVIMMAMSFTAFADNLSDGVTGAYTQPDTEILQDSSINLKKELIVYNANGTTVHAPAFSYLYTVTPADVSANQTVTDEASDHLSETPVSSPIKAGITAGLVVNGTEAGEAGDAEKAIGSLVFTNTDTLTSAAEGQANTYDINISFAGVAFEQPGIYRYQIVETLADEMTYDGIAVEGGKNNNLFLDVYVDGELRIYGYVCSAANDSVTPASAKTNGFVAASEGADKYYTYDLTLSKNVENDAYGEKNVAFPFTVIFNNNENYQTTFTIDENVGKGSEGISPAAEHAAAWRGVAKVKEGGEITYTGIPAGVDVDVYETNIATGVTYTAMTAVNGETVSTDNNVTWGSAPEAAADQIEKAAAESSKATIDTQKIASVSAAQSVAITNTLMLISPTGVVMRVAPYILILAAGLVLLVVARRRKAELEA